MTQAKMRSRGLSKAARNIVLIVSFFLIFDVLVAVLVGSYLVENIATFLGKSRPVILSDLLFLEGGIIFALGAFVTVMGVMQEERPSHNPPTEKKINAERAGRKLGDLGVRIIIIGVILIGLSILVGTLPF